MTQSLRLLIVCLALVGCHANCTRLLLAKDPDTQKKSSANPTKVVSGQEALEMLKAGNRRFLLGRSKHPHEDPAWRLKLRSGQKPFATILGCSDSRVTPELIFDEGLGDLFVIRVAGNIASPDVKASIEYAVEHLDTRLVVVLGHESCGAVTAAVNRLDDSEPQELLDLVKNIQTAIEEDHKGEPRIDESSPVSDAIIKNVLAAKRALEECPDLSRCVAAHDVLVVGAIYELKSGAVSWLDTPQ